MRCALCVVRCALCVVRGAWCVVRGARARARARACARACVCGCAYMCVREIRHNVRKQLVTIITEEMKKAVDNDNWKGCMGR